MYRLGSEEVVSIGVTSKKRCDKVDPTLSRVGGVGSVHNVLGKPSELLCRRCGKADGMVLLTQLFAPFDLDRSLYVYACTNNGCASSSDGWLVFRNEATEKSSELSPPPPPQSQPAAPVKVAPPPPAAAMKAASSAWSFDDAGNGDDDIDDLLAMLEVRDKSLTASQSAGDAAVAGAAAAAVAAKQPPTSSAAVKPATEKLDETRLLRTRKQLPCYEIDDFEEEWDAALEHTEEDDLTAKVDDAHVHRLLQTYFRDEEDREHVDKLQQQFQARPPVGDAGDADDGDEDDEGGGSDGDGDADDDSDDDNEHERPTKKKGGTAASSSSSAAGAKTAAAAAVVPKAKAGKGPSNSAKVERYFHRRVSRHPRQVLRYAYGGSPLWSSALPPLTTTTTGTAGTAGRSVVALEEAQRRLPPCRWCGKARVFEFQLMPGLLSVWPSCAQLPTAGARGASATTATATTAATAAAAAESTDLDFGVVAVFTCPDSCAPPAGQVPYECVLVQPAIDSVTA